MWSAYALPTITPLARVLLSMAWPVASTREIHPRKIRLTRVTHSHAKFAQRARSPRFIFLLLCADFCVLMFVF